MRNIKGFSAVEGLLILIIAGILGFTGWYVYSSHNKTSDTLTNADLASSVNANYSKCPAADSKNQDYLTVTEWSVKVPLCTGITDLYYSMTDGQAAAVKNLGGTASAATFRTKALDDRFKNCSGNGLVLLRGKADDKYLSTDLKPSTFKDAFSSKKTVNDITSQKLGDYYYISSGPVGSCSVTGKYTSEEGQIQNTIKRALSQLKTAE